MTEPSPARPVPGPPRPGPAQDGGRRPDPAPADVASASPTAETTRPAAETTGAAAEPSGAPAQTSSAAADPRSGGTPFDDLGERPVAEHVDVFEAEHARLQRELGTIDRL